MARTEHYGFNKIGPGSGSLSDDGSKFTELDRDTIDTLIYNSYVHTHDGSNAETLPDLDPATLVELAGGSLPAGTPVYYTYTIVAPSGLETEGATVVSATTPTAVASPAAASLVFDNVGGVLTPGQYFYAITAYTGTTNSETTPSPDRATLTVPPGTSTNQITVTLPALPAGATGFNIYRRKPGGVNYNHIFTTVGGGGSEVVDNGIQEDPNRLMPTSNTTSVGIGYTVTLPFATTLLPSGYSWKLYRTFANGNWARSLLHHVVEETAPASGIIVDFYDDSGTVATSTGEPPLVSQLRGSPAKISLDDSSEVDGRLPLARMSAFPHTVTFAYASSLQVQTGKSVWVCPFPQARVISATASIGNGTPPTGADIIADINKGSGLTPTFSTIFTTQGNRPRVLAGNRVGAPATPDLAQREMVTGDTLLVDIDQVGSSTAGSDLSITVLFFVYGWTDPDSEVWV